MMRMHGRKAVYWPPQGSIEPITECRVIFRQPDVVVDFDDRKVLARSMLLEVRAAELPGPETGGTFYLGDSVAAIRGAVFPAGVEGADVAYRVFGTPRHTDPRRLKWQLEVEPCD